MHDTGEQAFDVPQLCKRWNVVPETVYKALADGSIPGFRIGRAWRVTAETVRAIEAGRRP